MLRLKVLGKFELSYDGSVIPIPTIGKHMLAYLALHRNRSVKRIRLAEILWPDFPLGRAVANLNTTLWRIRHVLPRTPDLLRKPGDNIALSQDAVTVDCWDFIETMGQIESGTKDKKLIELAVALYQGDLLEGNLEAEWVALERQYLKRLYIRALGIRAELLVRDGELLEASYAYRRLIELDPFDEGVCRSLMLVYQSLGRRDEALRLFLDMKSRLKFELAVSPEMETEKVYEDIRSGFGLSRRIAGNGEKHANMKPGEIRLVGREHELSELRARLNEVREGRLRVIALEGEVGIGKTRLILEFGRRVQEEGLPFVYAKCEESPRPSPYDTAANALRKFRAVLIKSPDISSSFSDPFDILKSFPGRQYPSGHGEARARFYEQVAEWLWPAAQQSGAVLVLDDLHFADSASLELLSYLSKVLSVYPLLMVLTLRSEDAPPRILQILHSSRFVHAHIQLGRLHVDEIGEMCNLVVHDTILSKESKVAIYRESEGNPLFAFEILRSLRDKQCSTARLERLFHDAPSLGVRTGQVDASSADISFRRVVKTRITRLPRDAKKLLHYAAALGRRLDLPLVSAATGISFQALLRWLEALKETGMITVTETGYEFVHDKLRRLCYESIPSKNRGMIHRTILEVLQTTRSNQFEELAIHSELAGEQAKASDFWRRVGDSAGQVWAHMDAARAYTRALKNTNGMATSQILGNRYQLLEKRTLAYGYLGELERAERDALEMQRIAQLLGDDEKLFYSLLFESKVLLRLGELRKSLERVEDAMRVVSSLQDVHAEAMSSEVRAVVLSRMGEHHAAEQELLKSIPLFEMVEDGTALERAWSFLARIQFMAGRNREALESLESAEKYWSSDLYERGIRFISRGYISLVMGRGDQAILNFELAERDLHRAQVSPARALANGLLAAAHAVKGDFVAALLRARNGLPHVCARGDARWRLTSLTNICGHLLIPLGSYQLARRFVTKAIPFSPHPGTAANLVDILAIIALEEGRLDRAYELAGSVLSQLALKNDSSALPTVLVTMGRIEVAMGRLEEGVNRISQVVPKLEVLEDRLILVQALSFSAFGLAKLGRRDEAYVRSRRALNILNEMRHFYPRPQEVYWNHFNILEDKESVEGTQTLAQAFRLVSRRSDQLGRRGRARFLTVLVNRQIVDAWAVRFGSGAQLRSDRVRDERELGSGHRVIVMIPRAKNGKEQHAPRGLIEVIWTVDAGSHDEQLREVKGEIGLRRVRILRLCAEADVQGAEPREEDLARVLGVSSRTIRSDIASLRASGCLVKTRG